MKVVEFYVDWFEVIPYLILLFAILFCCVMLLVIVVHIERGAECNTSWPNNTPQENTSPPLIPSLAQIRSPPFREVFR
ncbi:MAG: hypothetical protein QXF56_00930 [Candidatus Micrarchaeia archaeon]